MCDLDGPKGSSNQRNYTFDLDLYVNLEAARKYLPTHPTRRDSEEKFGEL